MKRHLTTIVLLALAIGLGVWVWRDRERVSDGERRSRENNVFVAWRREDLSRIEIAHEDEAIVIVRDAKRDSAWRMSSPRDERVDQQAIERLATTLEFATRVRKVGAGDSLGFDRPRASGSITMGGVVFHFALGGPSPRPEGSSYFRVDDGEPFVASKELTSTLLASSDAYRDRGVVPYLALELARFEVIHPEGGFVVERHDERSFKVPAVSVLASRTALDKVWSALAEMRAEAFPKEADVDRLTATPRMTIKMQPKDHNKPAGELVVGEACPGQPADVIVLRQKPTRVAACAPRGAIEQLAAITPALLVDKRPFSFRHDEIEELRLTREWGDGPKALEIARRGTGFHQREPQDRELTAGEAEAASELLVAMERTEASKVEPNHGASFEAIARARIRIGERDEIISIAEVTGSALVGRIHRQRDDAILSVPIDAVRRFIPRETSFRPLRLLDESRKVTKVILRCGVDQELEDTGEGLRLTSPAGYETDGSIVQLVDGIVRGKVLAWVADRDLGFGLRQTGCRAVLGFADGNAPATILFGSATEEGVHGTVDGALGVFLAPKALHELVKRIYVSHAALRTEPGTVTGVSVLVKGAPAPAPPLAQLREAAGAFYAERTLSIGSNFLGAADVEVQVSVADGAPPKRILCVAQPDTTALRCATQSVKAIFEVKASTVARFFLTDAGVAAVDAR